MLTSPEPEPSSARKSQFFRARAELSSEIQNYFEPEPSQARILTLSPSRAEPAQLELFGSSSSQLGTLCDDDGGDDEDDNDKDDVNDTAKQCS